MNKLLLSALLNVAVSVAAIAQNSAVTNAILYHKDNMYDKAKQEIDLAAAHEKTKNEPKTWYYKGVIYSDILRSPKPEYKTLSTDPLKEAYQAFLMSMQLDPSKGEYYKLSEAKLMELWADAINKGISEYEAEKSKEALESFVMAQKMRPADTSAYIYACYAAESLGDDASLASYTNELVKLNYSNPYIYKNRIYLEKDPAKKLTLAQEANAKYPKDEALTEVLGDTYAQQGKNQEALNTYKILNGWLPDNIVVLTKMAIQHEKLKNQDQALQLYEKILALEKVNFIANYNSAIIYFEKGKEENDRVHKLSMDEYHKQGKQLEEQVNKHFDTALSRANAALTLTNDESDIKNIKLMLSEIDKVRKK